MTGRDAAQMGDGLQLLFEALARKKLTSDQVLEFVTMMPTTKYLDMQIIRGPGVENNKRGGWSGWCIIADSHIFLETRGIEVYGNIFSCKPYNPQTVLRYCREELGLEIKGARVLSRGFAVADPKLVELEV